MSIADPAIFVPLYYLYLSAIANWGRMWRSGVNTAFSAEENPVLSPLGGFATYMERLSGMVRREIGLVVSSFPSVGIDDNCRSAACTLPLEGSSPCCCPPAVSRLQLFRCTLTFFQSVNCLQDPITHVFLCAFWVAGTINLPRRCA